MITLISSKKLGGYKIMRNTVKSSKYGPIYSGLQIAHLSTSLNWTIAAWSRTVKAIVSTVLIKLKSLILNTWTHIWALRKFYFFSPLYLDKETSTAICFKKWLPKNKIHLAL